MPAVNEWILCTRKWCPFFYHRRRNWPITVLFTIITIQMTRWTCIYYWLFVAVWIAALNIRVDRLLGEKADEAEKKKGKRCQNETMKLLVLWSCTPMWVRLPKKKSDRLRDAEKPVHLLRNAAEATSDPNGLHLSTFLLVRFKKNESYQY